MRCGLPGKRAAARQAIETDGLGMAAKDASAEGGGGITVKGHEIIEGGGCVARLQAGQQSAPHMHVLVCICSNVRQFHRYDGSTIKTAYVQVALVYA